jgi:Major tropism determinant N-terminal domain
MPITQISRIQHRRGLQENLPNLASGELGWALDTRKLYIGNGTEDEGAPATGVTEILTQFSDIDAIVLANQSTTGSFTLLQNQLSAQATALSFNKTDVNGVVVEYLAERNGEIRRGVIRSGFYLTKITNEDTYQESGAVGITLAFQISGANAVLYYTSTASPANNIAFTYTVKTEFKLA